jgi:hypothetical protein
MYTNTLLDSCYRLKKNVSRDSDAESNIAHETTDALTLSGHARTPSGCKSGSVKRNIIKNKIINYLMLQITNQGIAIDKKGHHNIA